MKQRFLQNLQQSQTSLALPCCRRIAAVKAVIGFPSKSSFWSEIRSKIQSETRYETAAEKALIGFPFKSFLLLSEISKTRSLINIKYFRWSACNFLGHWCCHHGDSNLGWGTGRSLVSLTTFWYWCNRESYVNIYIFGTGWTFYGPQTNQNSDWDFFGNLR